MMPKRDRYWMMMVAAVCGVAMLATPASAQWSLRLLHNNDGESQLIDSGDLYGGAARFVSLVNQQKASAPGGVLMLSSGDNFLAGPEFDASLATSDDPGLRTYYDALTVQAIGYDALALGNHDFDFGPDLLANFIKAVGTVEGTPNGTPIGNPAPYLSANLDFSGEAALNALVGSRIFPSITTTVTTEQGAKKIGIIGATTENLDFISSPGGVTVQNVATKVQEQITALQNQPGGVDKVVLISHLQGFTEEQALIGGLTGIDVVIAGGGDELLLTDAGAGYPPLNPADSVSDRAGAYPFVVKDAGNNDVLMVTTPGEYKYLGQLDITFNNDGSLSGFNGNPIRVIDTTSPDVVGADLAVAPDAGVVTDITNPVAAHIATLAATKIGERQVALDGRRSAIRARETNLGNLIADAFIWQADQAGALGNGLPTVAMTNGGGIRNNDIRAAGDFSRLDTFDILPFDNFVTVVESVTPDTLLALVENTVSRTLLDGGMVISDGSGTGRFAQVGGMSIVYDITAQPFEIGGSDVDGDGAAGEAGARVISIQLADGTYLVMDGQVVGGAPSVNVVTVNFLANGGDQWDFGGASFLTLPFSYQQALENFIADGLGGVVSSVAYPEVGGALFEGSRIVAVPEPVSLALLGLGGLVALRRRSAA